VSSERPDDAGSDGVEEDVECPGFFFCPGWTSAARFVSSPVVDPDARRWIDSTRFWSAARISAWDGGFPCASASGEHGPCRWTIFILADVAALGLCSVFQRQVPIGVRKFRIYFSFCRKLIKFRMVVIKFIKMVS
jgi:hypothetical protein